MKNSEDQLNIYRRSLMKMGFGLSAGALLLPSSFSVAKETISYPSVNEIVPEEWSGAGECIFTSSAIEGPYFLEDADIRQDIRDDEPGQELLLRFEVVDVSGCRPIPDAVVHVWHCNATGWYSGFPQMSPDELPSGGAQVQGSERFLRGAQVSDESGKCEFISIFPGWYSGRTVHIHTKVYLGNSQMLTTQLYFPDELNDQILQTGAYQDRGVSPYRNTSDMAIAQSSGAPGSWPIMEQEGGRMVATLRIGVLPL